MSTRPASEHTILASAELLRNSRQQHPSNQGDNGEYRLLGYDAV
jgi:hypothetical protein